jgi:hypothetical protein
MEKNLREVYSADKIYKINIIQELLAEHEIESVTLNKKDSTFLEGDIILYVNEKDEKKALEIIAAHNI